MPPLCIGFPIVLIQGALYKACVMNNLFQIASVRVLRLIFSENKRIQRYRLQSVIVAAYEVDLTAGLMCTPCFRKKTSTHIIGYKLRNSCLILIIFDIKIPHII